MPGRAMSSLRWRFLRFRGHARFLLARHPNTTRMLIAVALVLAAASTVFVVEALTGIPDKDEVLALGNFTQSTTVYDASGQRAFSIPTDYRIEVPLDRMSPNLRNAVVAVEDARFFEHDGIDSIRVVSAVMTDLQKRRFAEGASTITQQLARMSFLTPEKTPRRKIKEAILAQRVEHVFSKDQILELYLNKVYFGDGLYGAEAAARGYFGKPSSDLTVGEAAMLAGVVRAPSVSNPSINFERAIERRNVVLKLMLENRMIDERVYEDARTARIALHDTLRRDDPVGIHFKELIRRDLIERFGKEKVYEGRLKVYSTIDPRMQEAAEEAVVTSVREIEARGARPRAISHRTEVDASETDHRLQASLVALDAASGEIRALVGGRDPDSVGLNRVLQTKRQPGSAFKPFVYAAALENGYSPATILDNLNMPVDTYRGAWLPEDEHSTASSMTMRAALRTSSNRAAVRMLEQVGLERTVSYATQLGVGAVPNVPSLALGTGEVSLLAITSAYAAFAQNGVVREPYFIRRVEDQDGTVLFDAERRQHRAISETTAFLMASMLADVVDQGTASGARAIGFRLPAAGKTGTTNNFVDAWFIGFTPKIVTGVWVGFDRPRTIIPNGFAGQLAVPLWAHFMKAATGGDAELWFHPPPGIVAVDVCRISGTVPVDGCHNAPSVNALTGEVTYKSMVYREYFAAGREPRATCMVHAVQAVPYPEPYFIDRGFEMVGESLLAAPLSPPSPVEQPEPPPARMPELPSVPPEPPPPPQPESPPAEPAPTSPPSETTETPPAPGP
jgi:1A family penicillin-binding protein